MSLLESDSEIIRKSQEAKRKIKSKRKAGNAGLNRFKGLNNFGTLTENYRVKEALSKSKRKVRRQNKKMLPNRKKSLLKRMRNLG